MEEKLFETKLSHFKDFFVHVFYFTIFTSISYNYESIIMILNNIFETLYFLNMEGNGSVVLIITLFIPVLLSLKKFIDTYCKKYTFTNERLIYEYGFLNRRKDYIEFFRIKDFYVFRPIWIRIFGLSNFSIISTDRRFPIFHIKGINANKLNLFEEKIRELVEDSGERSRGREVDIV